MKVKCEPDETLRNKNLRNVRYISKKIYKDLQILILHVGNWLNEV